MPVEGRGLGSEQMSEVERTGGLTMSLETFDKVWKLQETLHAKAKKSPKLRFHALYDKVYRKDFLALAFAECKANKGAPGVDGVTFDDIEEQGTANWLGELSNELKTKTYKPNAVRRVWIPKDNGKKRPLGIPTIKDRVVQTVVLLIIEPIFEADLPEEQYAYRYGRSAKDAVRKVHSLICQGYTDIVDADLKGYFDSIPHADLLKSIARRICDSAMLALIKSFLKVAVEETDEAGRRIRRTTAKDTSRGIPQGAPISPLLSNIYMRRFILGWKKLGLEGRLRARIVNYADDFVICSKRTGLLCMGEMRRIMKRIGLTVHEDKTRFCQVWDSPFDFLGYTIGVCYKPETGRKYIGTKPSKSRVQRFCRSLSDLTKRNLTWIRTEVLIRRLNRKLTGWSNYFNLGAVSKAYRNVDQHMSQRLRAWLRKKHKVQGKGTSRFPDDYLYSKLGLKRLSTLRRKFS